MNKETRIKTPPKYLLILLLFALVASFSIRQVTNVDIWWHLKTGEYIVANFELPKYDVFSYTAGKNIWINKDWLSQIVFYLTFKIGDITALILLKTVVLCTAILALFTLNYKKSSFFSILWFTLVLFAGNEKFLVRPHIFTLLFSSLFVFILYKYNYEDKDYLWLLPIIQLAWVNMHGVFIIGIVLIFITLVGDLIVWKVRLPFDWNDAKSSKNNKFIKLLIIGLISVFVCFLNPYTYKGAMFPFLQYSMISSESNIFGIIISELESPFGSNINSQAIIFYKILTFLSIASFIVNIKKINISAVLIYIGFFYLSFSARTNIALFAFITAPIIVHNYIEGTNRIVPWIGKHLTNKRVIPVLLNILLAFLMLFCIFYVGSNNFYLNDKLPTKFGFGIQEMIYPINAVDFIEQNEINGNVFNNLGFGGYFLWRCYPKRKVFVDGRLEVYGEEFFKERLTVYDNPKEWNKYIDKYNINYVLLKHSQISEKRLIIEIYQEDNWSMVYFDSISVIFVKDTLENKYIIKKNTIDFNELLKTELEIPEDLSRSEGLVFKMNHENKGKFYDLIGMNDNAEHEFTTILKHFPECVEAHNNLGIIYEKMGLRDKAMRQYNQALEINTEYAPAYNNMGVLYQKMDKLDLAVEKYIQAIKSDPHYLLAYSNLLKIYTYKNNKQEAINICKEMLKITPKKESVHYNLGVLYFQSGMYDEGIKEIGRVIEINPNNLNAYRYRAHAFRELGKNDLAKQDDAKAEEILKMNER